MQVFKVMLNVTLHLVKVSGLLIKYFQSFSFQGAKGNLITTNFLLSNNHFGTKNSSFYSLNIKMRHL